MLSVLCRIYHNVVYKRMNTAAKQSVMLRALPVELLTVKRNISPPRAFDTAVVLFAVLVCKNVI